MKKLIYIAAALVLAACVNELDENYVEKEGAKEKNEVTDTATPGELVLYLDEATADLIESDVAGGLVKTKSDGLNSLVDELQITSLERLFPAGGPHDALWRQQGMHRYYIVKYASTKAPTKACELAQTLPEVDLAETVGKVYKRDFNDTYYKYQWHYYNPVNAGIDINVKQVWENYTTGSSNVIVCVVDEGVCYTHEDLAANMWSNAQGQHGWNFVDNSKDITWNASDDSGHGTHVAGTVAAISNNGKGVAGVAGGDYAKGIPGVKIMSAQIFSGEDGASDYYTARAIAYGEENGAVISQNSWGYFLKDSNNDGQISASEWEAYKNMNVPSYLRNAITSFTKNAGCDSNGNQLSTSPMKGGLVFFAAGNDNVEHDPISVKCPEVVSVGSFGPTGCKASYSNYGDFVDLAAPGGDSDVKDFYINELYQPAVYSLGRNDTYTYRDQVYYNGKYYWSYWEGTSMACPHASGVAALAVSYFGGQGFTSALLREAMEAGADEYTFKGLKDGKTYALGRKINALGTFNYLLEQTAPPEPPAAPSSYTVTASGNTVTYSLSVGKDGKGNPIKSYILLASKDRTALAAANPLNPGSGISKGTISVSGGIGITVSGKVQDLDFSSTYYTAIAAVDSYNQVSVLSSVKSVDTGENNPPLITTTYTGDYIFLPSESVNIAFKVTEPDSHEFTVSFATSGKATFTGSGSTWYFRLTAKDETFDVERTARITAKDSYGLESYFDITYKVLKPEPPVAPAFSVSVNMNELTFSWKVGEDCFGNKIKSYKLFAGKSREDIEGLNPASAPSSVKSSTVTVISSAAVGASLSGKISGLEFDTPYYVTLAAYDANELWSSGNTVSDVRTQVNHAPVITTSYTGDYVFMHNQTTEIPFSISDPDGHSFTVSLSSTGKATLSGSGASRTVIIRGSAETVKDTPLTATLTATDSYGLASEKSFEYTILSNRAPVLSKPFEDHVINGIPYRISMDLSEYFTDPDGDKISFDVLADEDIVQISKVGTVLTLASVGYGKSDVTIIASDSDNADTKVTFSVLVRYSSNSVGEASEDDFIVDIYPNPVTRFLYVRGGVNTVNAAIKVSTSSGTVVYRDKVDISGFSPCAIDMKNTAPGQYSVTVEAGGNTVTKTVVKR